MKLTNLFLVVLFGAILLPACSEDQSIKPLERSEPSAGVANRSKSLKIKFCIPVTTEDKRIGLLTESTFQCGERTIEGLNQDCEVSPDNTTWMQIQNELVAANSALKDLLAVQGYTESSPGEFRRESGNIELTLKNVREINRTCE